MASDCLEYSPEKWDQILTGCFQRVSLQGKVMGPQGCQRDVEKHEGKTETVQGCSAPLGCS